MIPSVEITCEQCEQEVLVIPPTIAQLHDGWGNTPTGELPATRLDQVLDEAQVVESDVDDPGFDPEAAPALVVRCPNRECGHMNVVSGLV